MFIGTANWLFMFVAVMLHFDPQNVKEEKNKIGFGFLVVAILLTTIRGFFISQPRTLIIYVLRRKLLCSDQTEMKLILSAVLRKAI